MNFVPIFHQDINRRSLKLVLICLILLLFSAVITLAAGDFQISLFKVASLLLFPDQSMPAFVIWELRLPRFFLGIFVGAALGMAGAIVQSITRNPLGSPSLMGVTSGAAFAIVVAMVLFDISANSRLMTGTLGGAFAALLTFVIAWKTRLNPLYLTLSGMSIALFFASAISLLLLASDGEATGLYMWLTGSLDNRTWLHVEQLYPYTLIGLILGLLYTKPLDILMLDDDTITSLGVNILSQRLILGLIAVILTAATVAVAGPISFIGLIAPHVVRFILTPKNSQAPDSRQAVSTGRLSHKQLLPLSALVGATLISVADVPAKILEVPVGIFCILLGGPLFIRLIQQQGGDR